MSMIEGSVKNLSAHTEYALASAIVYDRPIRWSDDVEMPRAPLFVADLGECLVTSCFIPIRLQTQELFFDQTYENVRQFHGIRPVLSDGDRRFVIDGVPTDVVSGTTLLVGGSPENNWYHWVLNWFPRLTLAITLFPTLLTNPEIKFGFHANAEREPYRSTIDMLGIPADRLFFFESNENYRFERLLVPTFGNPNYYYPEMLSRARNSLAQMIPNKLRQRLYVSRETIAFPKRRVVNREAFYKTLIDVNLEPVVLEEMTGRQVTGADSRAMALFGFALA